MDELFARFMTLQTEAYRKMLAERPVVPVGQQNPPLRAVKQEQGKDDKRSCGKIKFTEKEIKAMPQ